jgi:hypothetical protein
LEKLSTATFAAEIVGMVSVVDDKGMATIKTTDGKELNVQMAGVKVGDKVDCHPKGGKMSCHKLTPKHLAFPIVEFSEHPCAFQANTS